MKPLMHPVAGLALLLPIAVSAATLGGYPPEETCRADREASFASGYSQGYSAGESNGFQIGHQAGHDYGIRNCVADPLQFGVTLASVIPAASYGETEPNDNFISADPIEQGVNFWGQLYGVADQDWFYTETTAPNQNILVTFSVPYWINDVNLLEGKPAIWNISLRDAAGNVFANYNTNVMGAIDSYDKDRETYYSMTYSITAGLVGSYYVVVKPADGTLTSVPATNATIYPYSVAVVVQDSSLPGQQPIVGFYDAEIEPNDVPSRANPLATGVTMYGLINLTFNQTDNADTAVWLQGENDWFVYNSKGNEIVTLNFCAKERCAPGDWFVEVYDQFSANALETGAIPRERLKPLLAFNTNLYQCDDPTTPEFEFCSSCDDPATPGFEYCSDSQGYPRDSQTYRIGLSDPGYYFMRVNHMRLFNAPCVAYNFTSSQAGGGFLESCGCSDGGNKCFIPTDRCKDGDLLCVNQISESKCVPGVQPGCNAKCTTTGIGENQTEECDYWFTQAECACSQYGGTVVFPSAYTSPYNFTWHGTQLPPSTIDTDAYEDYLDRPNPYTP